jgi:hypothetical protein
MAGTLFAVKVAGLIFAGLFAVAGWSSPAQASSSCAVRGRVLAGVADSRVIAVKGEVVVYRVRREPEHLRLDTVWVCDRKHHRAVRIGLNEWVPIENLGEGHIPNQTLEHVQIAGPWVLATQTKDEDKGACYKYEMSNCSGPSNTLVVANAALGLAGSLASIRDYVEKPSRLGYVKSPTTEWTRTLLSPLGAVAWLEESGSGSAKVTSLYACLAKPVHGELGCTVRAQGEGAIEPDSVKLARATLTWTVGGTARRAVL